MSTDIKIPSTTENPINEKDMAIISNFFSKMQNERALCLGVTLSSVEGISVRTKFCSSDGESNNFGKTYMKLPSSFVYSSIDYCKANKLGFMILHNHPAGNCLSIPDIRSKNAMLDYCKKTKLNYFIFGIFAMDSKLLRCFQYKIHDYQTEESVFSQC